jgi:hypothetical protein
MPQSEFSAAGIRAMLARKREERLAEERHWRETMAAEHAALHRAFEEREVPPDAMERVSGMVQKAIESGEKEALVFRFPSEFMQDSGRSLTSHLGDWRGQMTGAAAKAIAFFDRELAPRGFHLRAGILDYKDGMPGDVGFWLRWDEDEALR